MTKIVLLAGLAFVVSSAAMTTYAEAQYYPGARMQMPTRGQSTYRPTASNIFPRQALQVPNRITVRHSESAKRR